MQKTILSGNDLSNYIIKWYLYLFDIDSRYLAIKINPKPKPNLGNGFTSSFHILNDTLLLGTGAISHV